MLGIAAGVYGAWWVSWLAHALYLEKAGSFDALNMVMLASFLMAAVVLCPLSCGLLLKSCDTGQSAASQAADATIVRSEKRTCHAIVGP
ncbi:hypothetical protein [Paracidovorax cattleyae]|uniref:hypothetical protein n=1 Tax=Paracidovorax cattleyae TaxID=80868 RepID=UPI00115FEA47|nr:hypothetical protein [Paracidovorax cattleyae]